MGKSTGFLEYTREVPKDREPLERIKDWKEFHLELPEAVQQIQGARCMDCGVPYCHSGMMIAGGASGCPIHNLIPEWNDMIYKGLWKEALVRLLKTNNFPEFTGRVCPAPCEGACTVGLNRSLKLPSKPTNVRLLTGPLKKAGLPLIHQQPVLTRKLPLSVPARLDWPALPS